MGYKKTFPYHFPYKLYRDWEYEDNKNKAIAAVKDGMSPQDACMMVYGITHTTWYDWVKFVEEDLAKGFTEEDSRLIDLMLDLAKEELELRRKLERKANMLALDDDNTDMLKFLLERRHGYTKQTKKDVDVEVKEDVPIKFEFVDMEPTDNEEE